MIVAPMRADDQLILLSFFDHEPYTKQQNPPRFSQNTRKQTLSLPHHGYREILQRDCRASPETRHRTVRP